MVAINRGETALLGGSLHLPRLDASGPCTSDLNRRRNPAAGMVATAIAAANCRTPA